MPNPSDRDFAAADEILRVMSENAVLNLGAIERDLLAAALANARQDGYTRGVSDQTKAELGIIARPSSVERQAAALEHIADLLSAAATHYGFA